MSLERNKLAAVKQADCRSHDHLKLQIADKKFDTQKMAKMLKKEGGSKEYIRSMKQFINLKQTDIEVDECLDQSNFKKRVWNQLESSTANSLINKKKAYEKLFNIQSKVESLSPSPVRDLIRGNNS
jgi:hypothetical protein